MAARAYFVTLVITQLVQMAHCGTCAICLAGTVEAAYEVSVSIGYFPSTGVTCHEMFHYENCQAVISSYGTQIRAGCCVVPPPDTGVPYRVSNDGFYASKLFGVCWGTPTPPASATADQFDFGDDECKIASPGASTWVRYSCAADGKTFTEKRYLNNVCSGVPDEDFVKTSGGCYAAAVGAYYIPTCYISSNPPSSPPLSTSPADDPCFDSSSTATLANGTVARLDMLKAGDAIVAATSDGTLTTGALSFLSHADASAQATFVVLSTVDGRKLTLTPQHHVPTGPTQRRSITRGLWPPHIAFLLCRHAPPMLHPSRSATTVAGAVCCSDLKLAKDVVVGDTVYVASTGVAAATPSVVRAPLLSALSL